MPQYGSPKGELSPGEIRNFAWKAGAAVVAALFTFTAQYLSGLQLEQPWTIIVPLVCGGLLDMARHLGTDTTPAKPKQEITDESVGK
jgi:tripartite-type tricarboxylate transporter receptor subunit TctC